MKKMNTRFFKYTLVFSGLIASLAMPDVANAGEYCFGAVGQGCGTFGGGPLGSVAFCAPNLSGTPKDLTCQVNGGSMTHDPCCFRNPYGTWCGQSPSTTQCEAEWNRAVDRTFWGYNWKRNVNSKKENTSGNVVFADYAARNGQGVHKKDKSFCKSGRSEQASFWDRVGRPSLYVCID
jgi:hypothetical protein